MNNYEGLRKTVKKGRVSVSQTDRKTDIHTHTDRQKDGLFVSVFVAKWLSIYAYICVHVCDYIVTFW